MNTRSLTSLPEAWQPAALVFAALGDTTRQRILLLFEPGEELSIKDIVEAFTLSRTAVVHHLDVLERAGILVSRRQGKASLYRVVPGPVLAALDALRTYILEEYHGHGA